MPNATRRSKRPKTPLPSRRSRRRSNPAQRRLQSNSSARCALHRHLPRHSLRYVAPTRDQHRRDDLRTRSGAAAVSATNVERQARAREDGTDDHPNERSKVGSLCRKAGRAQSPRGAAASTTVAVDPFYPHPVAQTRDHAPNAVGVSAVGHFARRCAAARRDRPVHHASLAIPVQSRVLNAFSSRFGSVRVLLRRFTDRRSRHDGYTNVYTLSDIN